MAASVGDGSFSFYLPVGQHSSFMDLTLVQQDLLGKGDILLMNESFYVKVFDFLEEYLDFEA